MDLLQRGGQVVMSVMVNLIESDLSRSISLLQ
jgi:hypothetical protein